MLENLNLEIGTRILVSFNKTTFQGSGRKDPSIIVNKTQIVCTIIGKEYDDNGGVLSLILTNLDKVSVVIQGPGYQNVEVLKMSSYVTKSSQGDLFSSLITKHSVRKVRVVCIQNLGETE